MACHIVGAKAQTEPILTYCQFNTQGLPLVDLQQFDDDSLEPIEFGSRDVLMFVLMSVFTVILCIGVAFLVYRFCFPIFRRKNKRTPVATKHGELTLEELAMSLE